jgi:hypothetical protein
VLGSSDSGTARRNRSAPRRSLVEDAGAKVRADIGRFLS